MSDRYKNSNFLYINPIGEYKDISYNNIEILKNSNKYTKLRLEDSEKINDYNYLTLSIWSMIGGVSIILLLILLKNVRNS